MRRARQRDDSVPLYLPGMVPLRPGKLFHHACGKTVRHCEVEQHERECFHGYWRLAYDEEVSRFVREEHARKKKEGVK